MKEYYPHQSADSKNSADLCLQVDASTDWTSLPVTLVYTIVPDVRISCPPPPGKRIISLVSLQWTRILTLYMLLLALCTPPHSTAIQGWKKFSKMQLQRAATSLDCSVEWLYMTGHFMLTVDYWLRNCILFHRLPSFWGLQPCDTWCHVIWLPVNNRFTQNGYG